MDCERISDGLIDHKLPRNTEKKHEKGILIQIQPEQSFDYNGVYIYRSSCQKNSH